jgi:hypothetical protein
MTALQVYSAGNKQNKQFKAKVGNILAKATALRINLNIDGTPIASKSHQTESHTHPSHSQTSRPLTSSVVK